MMTQKELVQKLVSMLVDDPDLAAYAQARADQVCKDHNIDTYDRSGDDHVYWPLMVAEQVRIVILVANELSGPPYVTLDESEPAT